MTNLTSSKTNPNHIHRELSIYKSINLETWIYIGNIWSVEYDPSSNNITDLDNCFITQSSLSSNTAIIGAFRYHTGCYKHENNPELYCTQYSIQSSISYDFGHSWSDKLSIIISLDYTPPFNQQPPAVWEPFIIQPSNIMMNTDKCNAIFGENNNINNLNQSFMVYYSQELYRDNLLQQDIRMRYTNNNGINWSDHDFITCNVTNSRNGMPGVIELNDNSLFIVMEGFWGKYGWGYFTVNSMRSFDCGVSWTQKYVVYEPQNKSYNAGAADTSINKQNGIVYVSFMCDVPVDADDASHLKWPDSTWPSNAYIRVIKSTNDGANGQRLLFDYDHIEIKSSINAYWPALFVNNDNQIFVQYQQNARCYVDAQPCD